MELARNAYLLELCAEGLEAAEVAQAGGADRVELCARLAIGGLTPELAETAATVRALSIPVHVLIRPRGGDFLFSAGEFSQMQHQVEQAKRVGASGVVVGVLLPDGRVDVARSRALVELARPMSVTFHRAIDETPDLNEALEAAIETGADCLLTSGGAPDVLRGADSLARLRTQAGSRIQIIAGGGLRLTNLVEVVRRTGVSHVHGSLIHRIAAPGTGEKAGLRVEDVREAVSLLRREFAGSGSKIQAN